MQKAIALLCPLILVSCTLVLKSPEKKYSLQLFEEVQGKQEFIQSKKLKIMYISCRKRWFSNGEDADKYLRKKFEDEYGVKLYGLSNLQVKQKNVIDSNFFIPNEVCHEIIANPVTKVSLDLKKERVWEIVNPDHHIH